VPGSGDVAVVLSRSITAVLVDRAADLQSCLRAEAKPFISAALRRLFDQQPAAFAACRSPLGALLGGWWAYLDHLECCQGDVPCPLLLFCTCHEA
jgi:hypothetical protein